MKSVPGYKREAINRMGARVRGTLKRCQPPMAQSMRLMAVHVLKEGILRGLQGDGFIHPGNDKLAMWGNCGDRQARRNVRAFETWGFLTPLDEQKGGKLANRFAVEPEAIIRVMQVMRANPSDELVTEIRDFRADMRADIQGGHEAGHMSAGIYNTTTFLRVINGSDPAKRFGGGA